MVAIKAAKYMYLQTKILKNVYSINWNILTLIAF